MRWLVDRCAGTRLAAWLRDQGHDVVETRTLGTDPGDPALLQLAVESGRVLVTIDTDFGQLIHLGQQPHCGIVRLPDVPARPRISLLADVLERHANDLEAGALITVRGTKIRVSRS